MNGNVTKDGITADLEAMARVGIGGVQIFDAGLALPKGPVEFASDAWFDCLVHADREAKRLGIELCVANCSGWTSSAGPWLTPELSMKYVTNTAVRVKGGEKFDGGLPMPEKTNGFYEDIAVLAFPTPAFAGTLHGLPDFDLQVFRGRGNFNLGAAEGGPQMPVRITDKIAPAEACIASPDIIDLTARCSRNGNELRLAWDAPPSHKAWTVLRIGYMANGRTNRSASKAGLGLECDKLDPHALDVHFDAYVGRLLKKLPKDHALNGVLLDSYEVYGQNWTRGFDRCFAEATGYSITNFLPVLAGYPVDGAERTETFLRDFRRVISTMFCRNYSGRLRERCNENGLLLYCEPYGNGPFNDLEFAREIATRIVFMADGMIREDGTADEILNHPQFDRTQSFIRKNSGFYRELNSRFFDPYEFEGAIEAFSAGKLIPPEKRRILCNALKTVLLRMIFPHVSRIVLTIDVKPESGDVVAIAQYPGSGFDPLTRSSGEDEEAAKAELLACVKSARYRLPASGKNEFIVTI